MAELKTKTGDASVDAFLNSIGNGTIRRDPFMILNMTKQTMKSIPGMWGTSMVGFGSRHHRYASSHEGDTCILGFPPRKPNLTLYFMCDIDTSKGQPRKLGKQSTGNGCLYIQIPEDVDHEVLKDMLERAAKKKAGPSWP